MAITPGDFATMVLHTGEICYWTCFDIMFWLKRSLCTPLLCEVNLSTEFPESLGYYFVAYCCNVTATGFKATTT